MAKVHTTLMWILTLVLIAGFMLIAMNLNGKHLFTEWKYEGFAVALFGLVGSIIVGVNSSPSGVETFANLYE